MERIATEREDFFESGKKRRRTNAPFHRPDLESVFYFGSFPFPKFKALSHLPALRQIRHSLDWNINEPMISAQYAFSRGEIDKNDA